MILKYIGLSIVIQFIHTNNLVASSTTHELYSNAKFVCPAKDDNKLINVKKGQYAYLCDPEKDDTGKTIENPWLATILPQGNVDPGCGWRVLSMPPWRGEQDPIKIVNNANANYMHRVIYTPVDNTYQKTVRCYTNLGESRIGWEDDRKYGIYCIVNLVDEYGNPLPGSRLYDLGAAEEGGDLKLVPFPPLIEPKVTEISISPKISVNSEGELIVSKDSISWIQPITFSDGTVLKSAWEEGVWGIPNQRNLPNKPRVMTDGEEFLLLADKLAGSAENNLIGAIQSTLEGVEKIVSQDLPEKEEVEAQNDITELKLPGAVRVPR